MDDRTFLIVLLSVVAYLAIGKAFIPSVGAFSRRLDNDDPEWVEAKKELGVKLALFTAAFAYVSVLFFWPVFVIKRLWRRFSTRRCEKCENKRAED